MEADIVETDQESTIQNESQPETVKRESRAPPKKPKKTGSSSHDTTGRIAQLLQKQSSQLDKISKTLEKQQLLSQQLKSSVGEMEKRMRATEKMDSIVFEWVNRKIAKKEKKKKSKK
jgi:hypothetical protein